MSTDPNYEGLLSFRNRWSQVLLIKHLLLIVMAAAGLTLQVALAPALERTSLLLERGKGDARRMEPAAGARTALDLVHRRPGPCMILAASAWLTAI